MFDTLWKNLHAACFDGASGYGIINNAAIGITDNKIAFIGPEKDLPADAENSRAVYDAGGRFATPALIDCHTHLVYAGNRADEFEKRLKGASYADIAAAGGGILSTVTSTRAADEDTLYEQALNRFKSLWREGVATVEIKSGYGLDLPTERKMLAVATRLRDELGITVQRTFLGAHALPPEYKNGPDDYISHICDDMLPQLAEEGLVDAVDGFCENIAFTPAQIARVFDTAKRLNIPVKLHAEQLSNQHGTALAAGYDALSADHLEYLDEDGVIAMKKSGTVATLLPGAFYILKEKQLPPVNLLRQYQVPVALATDHNPGTSPILSILTVLNMAATFFGLTPEEALRGVTINAAHALGLQDQKGSIEKGKSADIAFWDISHPRDLVYMIGGNTCAGVFTNGHYFWFGDEG